MDGLGSTLNKVAQLSIKAIELKIINAPIVYTAAFRGFITTGIPQYPRVSRYVSDNRSVMSRTISQLLREGWDSGDEFSSIQP